MEYYAGSWLEVSDEPSHRLVARAKKVFDNGRSGDNTVEKLVVEVEIRLPAAVKNADRETKAVMVAKLIEQLKIHLESLEKSSSREHRLRRAREFLEKDEGTKWVHKWFERAPTSETNVSPALSTPAVTARQTLPTPTAIAREPLPTPTRDEERDRRASLHNVINQPPIDEHLLRLIALEPRLLDALMSLPSLAATPTEAVALQTAVVGSRRLPAGLAVRQEHAAMSHRRNGSASHPMLRPCLNCGNVHGIQSAPVTNTTVIVFSPLSKRAICLLLFILFWQFVFFIYGARASSKA